MSELGDIADIVAMLIKLEQFYIYANLFTFCVNKQSIMETDHSAYNFIFCINLVALDILR